MTHSPFSSGGQTWSVITQIVAVGATAHDSQAELLQPRGNLKVKLAFAVITTGTVIRPVSGFLEFRCIQNLVPNTDQGRDFPRGLDVATSNAWAIRREGNRFGSNGKIRGLGDNGTVHASAQGHSHGSHLDQNTDQSVCGLNGGHSNEI